MQGFMLGLMKETDRNVIEEYQKAGWTFEYEAKSRTLWVFHPKGAKRSICKIVHLFEHELFGRALESLLNKPI